MPLPKGVTQKIIDRFYERAPKAKCPLCGTNQFALSNGLFYLVEQDRYPSIQLSGKGLPLVALACDNCGSTYLLNLIQIGLEDVLRDILEANEERKAGR